MKAYLTNHDFDARIEEVGHQNRITSADYSLQDLAEAVLSPRDDDYVAALP